MSKRRNIIRKCLLNHAPNKSVRYRYFTNLTIESLIRRRFFYSYSQNFWAAEISSHTVIAIQARSSRVLLLSQQKHKAIWPVM